MNKVLVLLAVILVAATAIIAAEHLQNLRVAFAASLPQLQHTPQEGKGCAAPKSWGELKGISDRAVAFEDSSGTIRVLDAGPCMRGQTQLIVKITRQ